MPTRVPTPDLLPRLPALLALPLALAFALGGCGDGGSPTDSTPPPPPVQVSITPTSASLDQGATASFTATVTNAQNTAVSWTTTGGTLSGQGNSVTLTAPASAGQVTVTATSVADGTRSASATVTVAQVGITLAAPTAPILRHGTGTVTAQVTGTVQTGVSWDATCDGVTSEGSAATWSAPGTPATCSITATSTADPSRSATAELAVDPAFVVNATNDADDGRCDPDHCSLREALVLGLAELEAGADEVQVRFAPALNNGTVTLESALPTLRGGWTITGPGPDALTIDANAGTAQNRRVFFIVEGDVTLEGMTLTGGSTEQLAPAFRRGGGIFASAGSSVQLRDLVVRGNQARASGGGVAAAEGSSLHVEGSRIVENEAGTGGGVSITEGSLVVESSEVAGNVSVGFAGGIYVDNAELVMNESQVRENVSGGSGGGVVLTTSSTATMENSLVEENRSTNGWGGGVFVTVGGSLSANGLVVRNNRAARGAGGAYFFGAALEMTGSVVEGNVAESEAGGGLYFREAQATLAETRLEGNRSVGGGGGGAAILFQSEVTMEAMEVVGNEAQQGTSGGGGVFVGSLSQLVWTGGLAHDNQAESQGGGIYSAFSRTTLRNLDLAGNEAGTFGGGVAAVGPGPFLLEGSTLRGNLAGNGGGGLSLQVTDGGAEVRNLTISGNRAQNGAAIRIGNSALLEHLTLVGNLSAPTDPTWGGAVFAFGSTTQLRFRHLLMDANRTDGEPRGCVVLPGGATIVSEGGNIIEDEVCAPWLTHASDRLGVDPGVAAELGNHGGATLTHALTSESPAIGAGNPATCPATDQRGFLRTNGCDAGAFQANGTAPAGSTLTTLGRTPRR